MSKFIVQSVIADAGKLSAAELGKLSQTTRNAFKKLGHSIRLVQSYVTGDKLHCVYVVTKQALLTEFSKSQDGTSNQAPLARHPTDF